jgi:hypothetical protein
LFYVSDDNILRDHVGSASGTWKAGTLSAQAIKVAAYSKLAAIRMTNPQGVEFIFVYYQKPTPDAAITSINLQRGGVWSASNLRVTDPPLFGTSLTAVLPRPGILVEKKDDPNARLPVVYLQMDSLGMGHFQSSGTFSSISV